MYLGLNIIMSDMPKTMMAAILLEQCKPLVIDEVSLPGALSFGQVLVKISYTGICGSQIGEIDGVKGDDPYLPHLLGHEGSGEVLEIGDGVKTVKFLLRRRLF
jgi:S-(hydroxymethyl)glutathione dehydrogenase / alcohol dehydrogenase